MEFGDDIHNHRQKYIEISTNMPGIGLTFPENFSKSRKVIFFFMTTNGRVQRVSDHYSQFRLLTV